MDNVYISLLLFVLIVGAIGYLIYWAAGALVPAPGGRIVQIIIAVLFAVVILIRVANTFGVSV